MLDRLEVLKQAPLRSVVGLNVGTSLDGIDAVLLGVSGAGFETRFEIRAFETYDFPAEARRRLLQPETLDPAALARLDVEVGAALGAAAREIAAGDAGFARGAGLVGSHGVTVWHIPPTSRAPIGASLQIGRAAMIAEASGALVVSDFRAADLAASGQGAPLMPWLDHLLFHDEPGTVLLNLGGIGNLTRVDELPEEVIAFDTGPANLPLNEIVRLMTSGEKDYDEGGLLASQGVVDPELMAWLESDPFLPMPPPKSTGRERFGEAWTAEVLSRQGHRRLVDILATMTAFVARAVKRGLDEFVAPRSLRRLLVSGGGVHNATLMHHLARELAPLPVESFAKRGFDPDAKEAVLFALLAHERLLDRPSGMPAATGATYAAIQGVIC